MKPKKWFCYSQEDGFVLYETEVEAMSAANSIIETYREDAVDNGEWDDAVLCVCYGLVCKKATEYDFDEDHIDFRLE